MPRSRSLAQLRGAGLGRRHGCACSSADVWVLGLGGTLETAVGRLSAKHRPQPLRSGAPGPDGRWPLAAPRGWEPWAAAGSGERNRQDLRLRALRRATQHVNVVYTERRGTWSSTAGARHGAAGPPASPHPRRARAISTKMQKDAHLPQHKSRPPRQVLGARAGTVGWTGVQGVAGRPGKRFRPRPVAHSPGPTAPEVAEERRTTPGRSARREELVRANGSIIFGETQDLSFFGHAPRAC